MELFHFLPTLVLVLYLYASPMSVAQDSPPQVFVTIDAAFTLRHPDVEITYMISGGEYQMFMNGVNSGFTNRTSDLGLDNEITAAIRLNRKAKVRVYGTEGSYAVNTKKRANVGHHKDLTAIGAPDAAGHRTSGHHRYFFYGCNVEHFQEKELVALTDAKSLGFPCDVDAAWSEGEGMDVLVGDHYWRMDADGSVQGPLLASDKYTLANGWVFRPAWPGGNRWW